MNADISETIRDRLLRFGMQIPELPTQRKFVSAACHAHSNCGSYSFDAKINILAEMYCSHQYLSIDPRPFYRQQTAQTCDAHNLYAR